MEIFREVTPLVEPLVARRGVPRRRRRRAPARPPAADRRADPRAGSPTSSGSPARSGSPRTKFVAKLASTRAKPDGLLVVPRDEVVDFLHPLPVGALWGVGERTEEALHRLGLRTVGDLAHTPLDTLQRALGEAAGAHLHALAWGRDARRVVAAASRTRASAPRRPSPRDVDDPEVVLRELLRLVRARSPPGCARPGSVGRTVVAQGPVRRLHDDHPVAHPAASRPTSARRSTPPRATLFLTRSGSSGPGSGWSASAWRGWPPADRRHRQLAARRATAGWREAERAVDRRQRALRRRSGPPGHAGPRGRTTRGAERDPASGPLAA